MDLVLDTSFLVASKIERDIHHSAARDLMDRISKGEWDHLILCDHVLSETLTVIKARSDHTHAVRFGHELLESDQTTFLVAGDDIFEAMGVFESEQDGRLSLVDCLLVHLARSYRAPIATFDAGFATMKRIKTVPGVAPHAGRHKKGKK